MVYQSRHTHSCTHTQTSHSHSLKLHALRAWNSTKMLPVPCTAPHRPDWCLSESIIEALSCRSGWGRKEGNNQIAEKTATEITTQGNCQGAELLVEQQRRQQQQLQLPEMRYKSQDILEHRRAWSEENMRSVCTAENCKCCYKFSSS